MKAREPEKELRFDRSTEIHVETPTERQRRETLTDSYLFHICVQSNFQMCLCCQKVVNVLFIAPLTCSVYSNVP